MKTLVLDAMGVIYKSQDDVAELLCPFIHEHSGTTDDRRIESLYLEASLGRISADQFWHEVGVDRALEDSYLLRHRLTAGMPDFLQAVRPFVSSIWCLSNDVSRWSKKLRDRFGLNSAIDGFVISGDVGLRKPDAAIYKQLLTQTGGRPEDLIFVDDRPKNLDAAAALGLETILFDPVKSDHDAEHRGAMHLDELFRHLSALAD